MMQMRGVSNSDREEKANNEAKKWITSNNALLVDHFAVCWKVKLTEGQEIRWWMAISAKNAFLLSGAMK